MIKLFGRWYSIQRIMKISIVSAVVGIIIILAFYFNHFHNGFAPDDSAWSNFGQFVGGILTPILTVLNLIFIGILTVYSTERDQERWLNQIRITSYKEMIDALAGNTKNVKNYVDKTDLNNYFFFEGIDRLVFTEMQKKLVESLDEKQKNAATEFYDSGYDGTLAERQQKIQTNQERIERVQKDMVTFVGNVITKRDNKLLWRAYTPEGLVNMFGGPDKIWK